MEILMQWLVFFFVLGILVLAHEFGHFLAARRQGIRVERFAFGFGPPLLRYRLKETDLLFCAIPLGGYVKMAGDSREETKGAGDEFFSKSVGGRAQVVFAGPLFNFVLALFIFLIIFMTGAEQPQPVVGQNLYAVDISSLSAPELRALVKDRVLVKKEITQDASLPRIFYFYADIESQQSLEKRLSAAGIEDIPSLVSLLKDSQPPAYQAGVREGDRIIEVNGTAVSSWEEAARLIRYSGDKVELTVKRNEQISKITVMAERVSTQELKWFMRLEKREISRIGIFPQYERKRFSFWSAGVKAVNKIYTIAAMLFKGLLFTVLGVVPFKESFAGPIGIFRITGAVARLGFNYLFDLIGVLSVSLGVINLFPIPVLDGGHLLFMALEKLRGKPVPAKWEEVLTWVGLGLLILFLLIVSYNDIIR